MQHDDFIGQVQHRAQLASRGDAERITRLVLEAIGERIDEGLAHKLESQLPVEIGRHLVGEPLIRLSYKELLHRLSLRERSNDAEAEKHAQAVMSVMREALAHTLVVHLAAQLPTDFQPLFAEEWREAHPQTAQQARHA
jgi:uncharacterized protein (DUF2267 family)